MSQSTSMSQSTLSGLLRCKACGYLIRESRLGKVCPACGLRRKIFEPYEPKVSALRRFILDLDLHPIVVHFPQAFCTLLPLLVLARIVLPAFHGEQLETVINFIVLLLPLSAMGAITTGLIDAKVKLKRLRNPAPLRKIIVGNLLLVLSLAAAAVVFSGVFDPRITRYVLLLLSTASLGCAVLLGMMGKKLINAILPG